MSTHIQTEETIQVGTFVYSNLDTILPTVYFLKPVKQSCVRVLVQQYLRYMFTFFHKCPITWTNHVFSVRSSTFLSKANYVHTSMQWCSQTRSCSRTTRRIPSSWLQILIKLSLLESSVHFAYFCVSSSRLS